MSNDPLDNNNNKRHANSPAIVVEEYCNTKKKNKLMFLYLKTRCSKYYTLYSYKFYSI